MKLSEAIRLGSMMKPQGFGDLSQSFQWRSNGPLGLTVDYSQAFTCALGAAYEAAGVQPRKTVISKRGRTFTEDIVRIGDDPPWIELFQIARCPACQMYKEDLLHRIIAHLNDDHRWTRERIADFVETFEAITECTDGAGLGPTDSFPVTHL